MSRTIFKKVSTYTRMGCDTLALDFSYKILYSIFIFIYKNLNITFKLIWVLCQCGQPQIAERKK